MLHAMAMLLRSFGHDVEFAPSGAAALKSAARIAPDVAILDIKLPDMNGYELGRRLKAMPGLAAVRLIALTGLQGEEFRAMSIAQGFESHHAKPIDPATLQALFGQASPHG